MGREPRDGGTTTLETGDVDPDGARRRRTLKGCLVALLLACPPVVGMFLVDGRTAAALVVVALMALGAIVLAALRRGLEVDAAAWIVLLADAAGFAALQVTLGGASAPAKAWVFVPAVLAGLVFRNLRPVAIFFVIAVAQIAGVEVLSTRGALPAEVSPASPALRTFAEIAFGVVLFGCAQA